MSYPGEVDTLTHRVGRGWWDGFDILLVGGGEIDFCSHDIYYLYTYVFVG